jgi:YebC/PmpR family DNA-binding regulatory protein
MAGHSHAKKVRKTKEADAKKRSQIFSKVARLIEVAVRQGGPNPETNPKLKVAIETAKSYNVPTENIERAIKRAAGEEGREKLEEVSFEVVGSQGVGIIVEGITENKNRALNELKQAINRFGMKLGNEGSVKWMFERKGCISCDLEKQSEEWKDKEKLEMAAIECGAEDLYWEEENVLDIYVDPKDLDLVKKALEEKGIKIDSATLDWKPKERVEISEKEKETYLKFFEILDETDFVQEIYSNLKI